MNHDDVIAFWFEETAPKFWWKKSEAFDQTVRDRFADMHTAAVRCELYPWRRTPTGRLAEIIVLDQFSRNLFRDQPASFASDALALCLAQEAVATRADKELEPERRWFCYMPFMHSESRRIHETAVTLFTDLGLERPLDYELRHKAVIDRFGRYPHRNRILGRPSTAEEIEFLGQPGSSF